MGGMLDQVRQSIRASINAVITDITGFATVAGQKLMANSFPVVVASDQSEMEVRAGSWSDDMVQTPTITAGLYAAGDNVGGLLTFANAARVAGRGGILKEVVIVDDASQSAGLELWLFNQTFTAGADNAPWTPVEAELHTLVTIVSTNDGLYYTGGATATVCVIEVARQFNLVGTSMFGRLVTRGTPTYVAMDDLTVIPKLMQD